MFSYLFFYFLSGRMIVLASRVFTGQAIVHAPAFDQSLQGVEGGRGRRVTLSCGVRIHARHVEVVSRGVQSEDVSSAPHRPVWLNDSVVLGCVSAQARRPRV